MSHKKHHAEETPPKNGEQTPAQPAPEAAVESAFPSADESVASLQAQLADVQSKADDYLNQLQRERADFSNFKKRTEAERVTYFQSAKGDVYKKVLPVLDDLERALANRAPGNVWADGVELVVRKFQSILESEGIKRIEADGQVFDPNLHEAISQEPSETVESGRVIAVVQQGYMMGDKVLRHAMVRVAQ